MVECTSSCVSARRINMDVHIWSKNTTKTTASNPRRGKMASTTQVMRSTMLTHEGKSTHRRCNYYLRSAMSTKVGLLIMVQKLLIVMVTTSLVFSTTMVSVSSKTPSLFPQRQHQQQHRRGRQNNRSRNNKKIIRNVSSSSSELKSHHQEAPWISGFKNSLASGLAAGCSKMLLAPFDIIKTLQQASLATAASTAGTTTAAAAAVSKGLSITQAAQVILNRPRGFLEFYVS